MRYSIEKYLVLALAITAGACGGDVAGPEEDPAPVLDDRWDMDVTIRYVRASSERTCDGLTIFGTVNPGEYQFLITGVFGATTNTLATPGYGQVTGESHELGRSEIHNFANRTWRYTDLHKGQDVALTMRVTEWDGASKDDYMDDRQNTLNLDPSSLRATGGSSTGRALGVGNENCGLTLYYDIDVVHREVTVG